MNVKSKILVFITCFMFIIHVNSILFSFLSKDSTRSRRVMRGKIIRKRKRK